MNEQLQHYLEQIEKALKTLPCSERVDIITEIKSEMLELAGQGMGPQEILNRLGPAKEMAKGYLGDSIAKSGFGWKKALSVLAFCGYAGMGGLFLLPITLVSAVGFGICGILSPAAGIWKLGAHMLGHEIPQIQFVMGSYSAGAWAFLPLSFALGALCLLIAWLSWKITVAFVRSIAKKR